MSHKAHHIASGMLVAALASSVFAGGAKAPFVLTTFTHMEASYSYPTALAFNSTAAKLHFAMSLFEEYGARMTIESEKSFAVACTTYANNLLAEAIARGHGVGTHCDFGANSAPQAPIVYAQYFIENKTLIDNLVGASNNRHCSGGMGESDWVLAAKIAGFDFRSEAVALGYLSMPMSARPKGWTNAYIRSTVYHDNCPLLLADRVHPLHLADALNWQDDAGEPYVLIGGGIGRIDIYAEQAAGATIPQNPTFNQIDMNLFFASLDAAIAAADPARFAKVVVHFALASLDVADEAILRQILARIRTDYIETGLVIWATQGDAYDAFTMWESGMPADLDHDGVVNASDLALLLNRWDGGAGIGDINFDGHVDGADLAALLSAW
ncbi:MAG: hypothetical protein EXS10_03475 [Phycisphaerales bacterium]|nr:hypothetical protein [Phycisphaerales bacterium]